MKCPIDTAMTPEKLNPLDGDGVLGEAGAGWDVMGDRKRRAVLEKEHIPILDLEINLHRRVAICRLVG
jgi:hypothetical protein